MKVLSLFDGISCGRLALERAGIPVEKYYASEIDKYAIQISQKNYPNIIELEDVNNWRKWDIDWKSIDLLIGGSPCQTFSNAGTRTGFDGKSGISDSRRYTAIGNGWTVDVIAQNLRKHYFRRKNCSL